jgi:NitT/TauT family transport system substrate-binding protein
MKTTRKTRIVIALIVIVITVSLISSSLFYLFSQSNYFGKVDSVIFGDLSVDSSELVYVARDQHLFENNGINLTIKNFDTSGSAISSLTKNDVDLTTSGEYPFVVNVLSSQNLSLIGTMDKFQAFYIIGNKDRGIDRIADLNGKNIGVVRQSLMEFYLGRFLDIHGSNIHNVNMVNVAPGEWVNAIANGTVDAIVVSQSYLSQVQAHLSDKMIVWSVQGDQLAYGIIFGKTSWINQHQALVNRFLKSLAQAQDYMSNHLTNAKNILQSQLKYNNSYLQELWPNHQFSLSLDQSLVLAMEDESRWMMRNDFTNKTKVPDFLNYMYINGLESVSPGSVNVFR